MQSQIQQLFRAALGLAEPWVISRVEFSEEQNQLDLWLDFPAGSKFACPQCGRSGVGAYDSVERTWRHLNFFQHKTFLHARQPRIKCPDHGVRTVEVPWARPRVGFTLLMEAFILVLVQGGMTPAQAARLIGEHDTRLWRVLQHYVEKARSEADFSAVTAVGVDETSRSKGHHYITVFMDLEPESRRVMFATEGKDAETVKRFREDLEAHGGKAEQIEEACLDMSAAFISGLKDQFPDAQRTFDNFHLMQLLTEAVDETRRAGAEDAPGAQGHAIRMVEERMEPHGQAVRDVQSAAVQQAGDGAGDAHQERLPGPVRLRRGRGRAVPEALVLLGDAQPDRPDHQGGQDDQGALGGGSAVVCLADQQRGAGGDQQPDPVGQGQGPGLPKHPLSDHHGLSDRRKAGLQTTEDGLRYPHEIAKRLFFLDKWGGQLSLQ